MDRGARRGRWFSRHGPFTWRDILESKAVRRPRLNSTLKSLLFWMVLVVVGVLIWNFSTILTTKSESPLPFSQFLKAVDENQVTSVVMVGHEITGTMNTTAGNGTDKFRTYAPDYEGLANKLHEKGIAIQ